MLLLTADHCLQLTVLSKSNNQLFEKNKHSMNNVSSICGPLAVLSESINSPSKWLSRTPANSHNIGHSQSKNNLCYCFSFKVVGYTSQYSHTYVTKYKYSNVSEVTQLLTTTNDKLENEFTVNKQHQLRKRFITNNR